MAENHLSTLNQEYSFIRLDELVDIPESEGSESPIYLDGKNAAYDRFYRRILDIETALKDEHPPENIFSRDHCSLPPRGDPKNEYEFPNPSDYRTKSDYFFALTNWSRMIQIHYPSVLFPNPLSGEFFLPSLPKIFTKEEENSPAKYKTFKPDLWPLLPANYLCMVSKILSNEKINPDSEFPEKIPKRDPILFKHQMGSDPQWQAQLIPHEPNPILYNSFDEFEQSYLRWGTITYNSLQTPPIPPDRFGKLLNLDVNQQSEDGSAPTLKEIVPESTKNGIFEKYISSAPCRQVRYITTVAIQLNRLAEQLNDPDEGNEQDLTQDFYPSEDYLFFGVKSNFLNEMMNYGTPKLSRNDGSFMRPVGFSQKVTVVPNIDSFAQQIQNCEDINEVIREMISYDFTMSDLDKLLSVTIANEPICLVLSRNPTLIKTILKYRNYTHNHKTRISLFLRAVLKNDESISIVSLFQNSIPILKDYLQSMADTVQPNWSILEIDRIKYLNPECDDIQQLYLFTQLLYLAGHTISPTLFNTISINCRTLAIAIVGFLSNNPDFVEAIRSDKDDSFCLLLLLCELSSINNILLGPQFLIWINNKNSPSLVQTIAHGSAMHQAALFLNKNIAELITDQLLNEQYTNLTINFIMQILKYLLAISKNYSISFKCNHFVEVISKVCMSSNPAVVSLMEPLSSLVLKSKAIIFNPFSTKSGVESSFETMLYNTAETLGKSVCTDELDCYIERLKGLIVLSRFESFSLSLAKNESTINAIVQDLNSTNISIMKLSWKLFLSITLHAEACSEVLSYRCIGEMVSAVISSGNIVSLKKLLKFLRDKMRNQTRLIHEIDEILKNSLGRIVCLYNTRGVVFKTNESVQKLLESFIQEIQNHRNESPKLFEALTKHMSSNDYK